MQPTRPDALAQEPAITGGVTDEPVTLLPSADEEATAPRLAGVRALLMALQRTLPAQVVHVPLPGEQGPFYSPPRDDSE